MIKDNNRKTPATRKVQQPTDHHHHHLPHHPHLRAASWHHNHHHNHHNHHHHHHHPHHRLYTHLDQEQRHLHQLQHLHNIHERHHQQRRPHAHPRHPHHFIGHDLVDAVRSEVVPQQPHSHQRHHLRLQNNSQYPLGLQQRRQDHRDGNQNPQSQQSQQQRPGSEPQPQDPKSEEQSTDQQNTESSNEIPVPASHQRSAIDFQKGRVHREKLLHPHCRNLLRGAIRARSVTPPAPKDAPYLSSQNITAGLEVDERKPFEKRVLRNAFSLPITNLHDSSVSKTHTETTNTANTTSIKAVEKDIELDNTETNSLSSILNTNPSSCYSDCCTAVNNNEIKDYNNSSTATTTKSRTMHLPLHTSLPDGCHVTVDAATERQISQMYALIQAAARLGEGYGADEYPTEDDFRQEIKGGHTFVVTARLEVPGEDLEDDELDDDDDDDEDEDEEEEDGIVRREEACNTGRLIAAFSLATSRFYRGNDVKVADPIVIVRREERGKGIGEFVFRLAVQFSRRLGFAGVYTDTFCNNTAMMRIIERHPGFKLVGYLPLGGKMPDGAIVGANIYFKDLRGNGEGSGSSR